MCRRLCLPAPAGVSAARAQATIDTQGAPVEGTTKADTIGAARALLVEQNLFPTKIEERRGMLDFELSKEKVKKMTTTGLRDYNIITGRYLEYHEDKLKAD